MNILGLNAFGHDSSVSLLCDEKLIFAVEEERLNRKKHSGEFPLESIILFSLVSSEFPPCDAAKS